MNAKVRCRDQRGFATAEPRGEVKHHLVDEAQVEGVGKEAPP